MSKANRPKKHGGKRPGAGRKPLPNGAALTSRVAIRLSPAELADWQKRAGDRTISEWLRELASQ